VTSYLYPFEDISIILAIVNNVVMNVAVLISL